MITSAPFMSCREDTDLSGAVIDSLKFAAAEGRIAGKLPLAGLPRLAEFAALARRDGALDCVLTGCREQDETDGVVRLMLRLQVSGRLYLHCQRCLSEVAFDCAIDSRLWLVPPEAEWPDEELETEEYDAIPASRELSVLSLIEDEVLLALPVVPRHAECAMPGGSFEPERDAASGGSMPFAALASLKKH